jgi:hypothetical protein
MKELECKNGELVKIDSSLYKKLNKYNWNVYYQEGRKPRIVSYINGTDTNIIYLILKLDKSERHSWELINGDDLDYRKSNIMLTDSSTERVSVLVSDGEKKLWKSVAKSEDMPLNKFIRLVMNKECRK